jgi:hypothetical protein
MKKNLTTDGVADGWKQMEVWTSEVEEEILLLDVVSKLGTESDHEKHPRIRNSFRPKFFCNFSTATHFPLDSILKSIAV